MDVLSNHIVDAIFSQVGHDLAEWAASFALINH